VWCVKVVSDPKACSWFIWCRSDDWHDESDMLYFWQIKSDSMLVRWFHTF